MTEYTITVTYVVDARDYDEAVEIAKEACGAMKDGSAYKLRDVETDKIEET